MVFCAYKLANELFWMASKLVYQ